MMDFLILGFEARRSGKDYPWQSVRYFSLPVNGALSAGQAQYLLWMVPWWAVSFAMGKCLPSADAAMMILGHTWL
jgi:hypothetical protein